MLKLKDERLLQRDAFVDGAWADASSGARFAVNDPATGERLAHVADLVPAIPGAAMTAAGKRFPAWRNKDGEGARQAILRKWFDLMMENQEDLARLMTAEQGKPLAESRGEIAYGAVVHRILRRGGASASTARRSPRLADRKRILVHQAADRRRRGDHAVELSQCDDHPQGRARRSPPAAPFVFKPAERDAAVGAGARRARASAPAFPRASSTSSPARARESAAN